jgi:hypothetical protein
MREHLESTLPVRLSRFITAANDNIGRKTVAEATIQELVFAIRCKLDHLPPHRRGLMAMLAAGAVACSAGKDAGHG